MRKILLLLIALSSILFPQERTYIEFIPYMSWYSETDNFEPSIPQFGGIVSIYFPVGKHLALKPFFEFENLGNNNLFFGKYDYVPYNKMGMNLRYYFGK